jgi:hypothetical protein
METYEGSTSGTLGNMPANLTASVQGSGDTRALQNMSPDLPADWTLVSGTHGSQYFQIAVPKGWQFINAPTAAIVVNPFDKNCCVSFMWFNGMNQMDPQTQLNNTIQYNGMTNYQPLYASPVQTINTPAGPYKIMEQDGTFDYRGERCRHHAMSMVSDNADPTFLFWNGSMIWSQAPEAKWDKYSAALNQIASSFKLTPPPAPPADSGFKIVPG